MTQKENENALKHLFGKDTLQRIAKSLKSTYPSFESAAFLAIFPELNHLEMKPRVRRIRDELHRLLPKKYPDALKILVRSVEQGTLKSFDLWPYTEFIQTHGLEHLSISLDALKIITRHFTSEWAVRPFIQKYPQKTMAYLGECSKDSDEHIRRWSSEGSRPRLPWGERLQGFVKDPSPTLTILENLRFDPELYVRKSVANHLNDISKDHPEIVVKLLKKWQKNAPKDHVSKINWIIRHSLRSLIKAGNSSALELIGVSPQAKFRVKEFTILSKKIRLGEKVSFQFEIHSESPKNQKLVIDYILHLKKSNQSTAPKVFKLKNLELGSKESLKISKAHSIKPITTRRYYPGEQFLEIQINGKACGRQSWFLA